MPKPLADLLTVCLFVLVVVPAGLAMRAFGRDPLGLRPAPAGASYWRPRGRPQPTADSLRRRT